MLRCTVLLLIASLLATASIAPTASTNLVDKDEIYFSESTGENENQTENESLQVAETSSDASILCFSSTIASIHQYGTCTIENLRNETLDVHINTSNPYAVIINYPEVQIPANSMTSIMMLLNQSVSEEHNTSNLPAQYTTNLQFQFTWNQSNQTSKEVRNFTFPMLSFFCINPDMSILTPETVANDSRVSGLTSCHLSNHLAYNLTLEFTPLEAYFVSGLTRVELNNSDTMYNGRVNFTLNESALRAQPYGSHFQHVELNITATQGNSSITLEPALVRFTVQHLEPIDPDKNPYEGAGSGLAYLLWEIDNILNPKDTPSTGPCDASEGCEEGSQNQQNTKGSFEEPPDDLDLVMLLLMAIILFFLPGMKKQTNE